MRMKSAERKKQIVNEAIKIIHEKGFPSLTIRELAGRVGISEPAIYRHFTSKDAIIMGILDEMEQFGRYINEKLEDIDGELKKIEKLFSIQLKYFEENQPMSTIMLSEEVFQSNDELKGKLESVIQMRYEMLVELLESAQRKNLIVDENVKELASIIMGAVRMWILKWKLSDFDFSLVEKGEAAISTFIGLIEKQTTGVSGGEENV